MPAPALLTSYLGVSKLLLQFSDKEKAKKKYKNAVVDDATIDDILLLYAKGVQTK